MSREPASQRDQRGERATASKGVLKNQNIGRWHRFRGVASPSMSDSDSPSPFCDHEGVDLLPQPCLPAPRLECDISLPTVCRSPVRDMHASPDEGPRSRRLAKFDHGSRSQPPNLDRSGPGPLPGRFLRTRAPRRVRSVIDSERVKPRANPMQEAQEEDVGIRRLAGLSRHSRPTARSTNQLFGGTMVRCQFPPGRVLQ